MGKSRSATVLLAYLLWDSRQTRISTDSPDSEKADMVPLPRKPLSVVEALQLLRQGRPIAEPNEGFMDQLHLYESMGCPTTDAELTAHKKYRRWMNKRSVEESLRINQAPEMDHIQFEDETPETEQDTRDTPQAKNKPDHLKEVSKGILAPDGAQDTKADSTRTLQGSPRVTIKCRKCRHVLATTAFILEHKPPPHRDPNDGQPDSTEEKAVLPPPQCAHIFLHPLSWMREVLSEGKMDGRLTCPNSKCGVNIGKFAWSGLRCSCGGWVTPGFGLIRGKVDEVVTEGNTSSLAASTTPGGGALRIPPNMRRGNL